ncbi:Hypothetical predicted protein [Scomber scombrus]|uniref:Uncharacterized protein n=1 Tax=Scomber scombrus TaxID=13677 RepID=A0AAV1Q374_SCOSC
MKLGSVDRVRGLLTLKLSQQALDSQSSQPRISGYKMEIKHEKKGEKEVPASNRLMSSIRRKTPRPTSDIQTLSLVQERNERPVCLYTHGETSSQNHNMLKQCQRIISSTTTKAERRATRNQQITDKNTANLNTETDDDVKVTHDMEKISDKTSVLLPFFQ